MNKLESFLQIIISAADNATLLKITIGNKKDKSSVLKNVFIKPVLIKEKYLLSFVYKNLTNDITKNFDIVESKTQIKNLLEENFFNADVYTT